MDFEKELKLEIADIERQIESAVQLTHELRTKRAELVDKRAKLISPFVKGDRIRFKTGHWGVENDTREAIVEGVSGTWGDNYDVYYRQILKGGKVSGTVRRLWDRSNIIERNGEPIEIKRGY